MNAQDVDGLIQFYRLVTELKQLRRQGWIDRGVEDPESVAAHSWGVALLGWLLAAQHDGLDGPRIVTLALAHDLAEALTGDLTPFDSARTDHGAIPEDRFYAEPVYPEAERERKRELERQAIETLATLLSAEPGDMIRSAWQEYEDGETEEARFVKQVDKLETLLQATSYQESQPEIVIESFWRGARRDIQDPELNSMLRALENMRKAETE